MKSFKQHLLEYLTDKQRVDYTGTKMTDKARGDTDHFFGDGNDLIKEPLKNYDHDKSEVHKASEQHLDKDISTSDYTKGLTQDKHGRDARIGRMISDKLLQTQFANDNTRAGSKQPQQHYVTTVRGIEVAGQANSAPNAEHPKGHSWGNQSCKNVDDGSNRRYLHDEIKHGTVLTRVHDHAGQEIYRATLHPHHNEEGHVAYALNSEYGVKHPSFTAHAHDVASRLSGKPKGSAIHNIHPSVYDDSENPIILHPKATPEHIGDALSSRSLMVRVAAIKHPNATAEHINTALEDASTVTRVTAINHPNATAEHINKALSDVRHTAVRYAAIQHPNVTAEHISTALKDDNPDVRAAAQQHLNKIKKSA